MGPMNVTGKSDIEPGLDEGLRMIKPGEKATFILPFSPTFGRRWKLYWRTIVVYWITWQNRPNGMIFEDIYVFNLFAMKKYFFMKTVLLIVLMSCFYCPPVTCQAVLRFGRERETTDP